MSKKLFLIIVLNRMKIRVWCLWLNAENEWVSYQTNLKALVMNDFVSMSVSSNQMCKNSNLKTYYRDLPGGAVVKNPPADAGDAGLSPGPGRSHMPRSS